MEDRVQPCQFCDELRGGSQNEFARRYGHRKSRVWLRSTGFVVQPSLGALTEGHSLIVPVSHALSMGQLSTEKQRELDRVMAVVGEALSTQYAKAIWFEHGSVDEAHGGCGIYHAHLHAVPVPRELPIPARLRSEFVERRVEGFSDARSRVEAKKPYLFYQGLSGDRYLYEVESLPSQFMRRLVAEELGSREWDWRTAGIEPEVLRATDLLEAATAA